MKKHRVRLVGLLALLAALLLVVGSVGAAPKDGLVVSLGSAQDEFSAAQEVLVTVTISNPTKHSERILKWFTPSEGVEEPIFVVLVNGEPAAYTGAVYKRPAATGVDYITLKAGQAISYTVNLGDYYDLSASGQYEVFYNAASYYLYNEKGNNLVGADSLTSRSISLKVEGRQPKRPTPTATPPPPGGTSFVACTTDQQNLLATARNNAKSYSLNSENYLLAGTIDSRYTTWFGTVTTPRYTTVTNHFTALRGAFYNAGVTFNCGCKQNYYAYVYPNQPYNIYLCRVFWQAPMTGTDSKAGTLIHEMSHFNVVAGTDDYVYGQAGAKSLAISDPNKAVNNADNHEYFAENTPSLP